VHREAAAGGTGTLYVVATPIGNLRDITQRALEVLARVRVIAAEDTRVTHRLLDHHGISAKLVSLHEHNERSRARAMIGLLEGGQDVALVSDAGTPALSDPGALLVEAVRARGLRVVPVPGPSALTAALSASGECAPHFLFYGFLPAKPAARRRALEALRTLPFTLVFYEAPHRIAGCIADLRSVLGGERRVTLARELTKIHETIHSCPLADAAAWLEGEHQQKGEFVVVISGAQPLQEDTTAAESYRVLHILVEALSPSRAADLAHEITGASRKALYRRALELKNREAR
jgi:16S rRNA (cytidine1402-2'-O)-methyltransferase